MYIPEISLEESQNTEVMEREAGAVILKLSYGYTVEPHGHDPLVDLANKALKDFALVVTPGAWIVNFVLMRETPEDIHMDYVDKVRSEIPSVLAPRYELQNRGKWFQEVCRRLLR